jgi:MYXO-CTERM domain-containing protein
MRAQSFLLLAGCLVTATARGAPSVWVIDDGEKIKRDATASPFAAGIDNPVWSPGQPIRLFALRNETVAIQVVVTADATPLGAVAVDLDRLLGPPNDAIQNAAGATDPTKFVGRPIERFVEHFFDVTRASGANYDPSTSLGWYPGSGPAPGTYTGWLPDALIPVEVAPSWSPYPLAVGANTNGIVWIDITVPASQRPGTYTGDVVVAEGGTQLASIPIELEVVAATLPDNPLETMLFYGIYELDARIAGGDPVERHLWQLLRRHRLTAMHNAMSVADVDHVMPALDGTAFAATAGYEGPGAGRGDDVLSLGTYGGFGSPGTSELAAVEAIADRLATAGLLGTIDLFVYAIDEDCSSSTGAEWKTLIDGSSNANVKQVKVGWTCSEPPAGQPVDLVMMGAASFDPAAAAAARAAGKTVWVYNGSRPMVGSFMTDDDAVSLRANGWIAAQHDVGRWFYWETTFWYDDNNGGQGPYDPFVTAETFHNNYGEWCAGDGVLLYPGRQVDQFTTHSVGMDGVIASIRLKNWRRGAQDAGYYQLAHAAAPAPAEAIASGLLPTVLSAATGGDPISWSARGKPFFDARQALLAHIPLTYGDDGGVEGDGPAPPDGSTGAGDGGGTGARDLAGGCGCRTTTRGTGWIALGAVLALAGARRRRRA